MQECQVRVAQGLFSDQSVEQWKETQVMVILAYVWRIARSTELLLALPLGATSAIDRIGAVVKFTFGTLSAHGIGISHLAQMERKN
jgi:hypothetical protein